MKEVSSPKWVSGTGSEPAQEPPATKTQAFRLSPPKSQFRESRKKCQVSCWAHKVKWLTEEYSTGIKSYITRRKGRKPLLLEAARHWSVQLHTAQKSNYTNTLCVRFPIKHVFQ